MSNMMLGWRNHVENATLASSTPAQTDAGVSKVVNRRVAKAFRAKASSRRQMSITLDLGLTYSQALARVITLTRHVLGTRGRFRIQAGNVADLGEPDLLLDFLTNTLDDRITFTRASTAAYWDADGVMQFAATDTARFDHHPVTGARRGLLVEGAGTNLLTYSQDFTNAAWQKVRGSVLPNVAVAPDGTATADKFLPNGDENTHIVQQASVSASASTAYTWSIFARPAGYRHITLNIYDGTSNVGVARFDLRSGAATSVVGTARVQRLPDGWFRLSVTATTGGSATAVTPACYVNNQDASYPTYAADTLSGVLLWGAHLEASSFPTSYIPTTTTSASRSADVATVSGSSFTSWFVPGPGTIEADGEFAHLGAFETVLSINDGTGNNTFLLRKHGSTNDLNFDVVTGGVVQASLSNTLGAVGRFGVAAAWAGKDFASSVNGRTSVTAAAGSLPVVTQMTIGQQAASGNPLNSHLRSIAYRPRRVENGRLEAWSRRGATINTDFAACDVDLPVEYTFTRASGGGYVDALGRLQGQYPAITAPIVPQTTRQERVKNGHFFDDRLWTKGTGWSIATSVATKSAGTASNLTQTIPTVPGQTYRLRATFTRSAGSVVVDAGGTNLVTVSADGSVSQTFTASATTTAITFEADSSFAGTVDSVSVTLDQGLKIPVGAGQDVKVGQLLRIEPQDATANTYMLGKVVAYDGAIVTVDVVEAAAPELVSNGHFTSATTGWTAGAQSGDVAVLSVSSGQLRVTNGATSNVGYGAQAVSVTSGGVYRLDYDLSAAGSVGIDVSVGTVAGGASIYDPSNLTSGTRRDSAQFTASAATIYINARVVTAASSDYGDFDNVSVKRAHTAWIVSLAGPRFTHDTDGTALGLLVEPAATNLLLRSQEFDNAWWTKGASTISANAAVAPNGETTADKLVESGTTSAFTVQRPPAVTGSHTFSVFAKAAERTWLSMRFTGTTNSDAYFNLSTGAVGTSSGCTASVVDFGDGWYRCIVTATVAGIGDQVVIRLASANNTALYAGDGSSGAYIWGAQIEAGSVATSYIPTFGVTRSRSADVCTIEGDEFLARYRQDEGAFYTAWRAPSYGTNGSIQRGIFGAYADINNRLGLLLTDNNPNAVRGQVVASGTGYALIDNTYTANSDVRTVLAYAADDIELVVDGSSVGTDTSATLPTVSSFGIGNRAGDNYFIGTISRLIFWPERRATADLVAMTTSGADLDAYTIPGTLADAYAGTYDSDWLDAWVGGHAATDLGANEATLRLILAADVAYRYWRIDQYDHPGPDADPAGADDAVTLEAGYLGLWRVWQPALNPVYGFQDILEARTRVLESWSGSEDFERRDPARALTPSWDYLSEADMKIARQIMRYADTDTPMYFILDPAEADDWIESDILCRLQSLTAIEAAVFERFSMAFRLKQWA